MLKCISKAVVIGVATILIAEDASAYCTGTVVNAPVTLQGGRKSDFYKQGETVWYITQYSVEGEDLFICSWGGDCVSGKDIHLSKVLEVQGNTDSMSGTEIRENSYETNQSCTLKHLEKVE